MLAKFYGKRVFFVRMSKNKKIQTLKNVEIIIKENKSEKAHDSSRK